MQRCRHKTSKPEFLSRYSSAAVRNLIGVVRAPPCPALPRKPKAAGGIAWQAKGSLCVAPSVFTTLAFHFQRGAGSKC